MTHDELQYLQLCLRWLRSRIFEMAWSKWVVRLKRLLCSQQAGIKGALRLVTLFPIGAGYTIVCAEHYDAGRIH